MPATSVDDRHFQIRHRWYNPANEKWITVDLLGPYTLADAISEAQCIVMLYSDCDVAYASIEDMNRRIWGDPTDVCLMVGQYGTQASFSFKHPKYTGT